MDGPRKGFTKERHSGLKAGMAAFAVLGFGAAWAGFSNAHTAAGNDPDAIGPVDAGLATATASPTRSTTPVGSGTPTAPIRTPVPSSPGAVVPTATISGAAPNPAATRAPKKSRGS